MRSATLGLLILLLATVMARADAWNPGVPDSWYASSGDVQLGGSMLSDGYSSVSAIQHASFMAPNQSNGDRSYAEQGKGGKGRSCPPFWTHRTGVFAEYMFLRPRDVEVAYGVPANGAVVAPPTPSVQIGPVGVVDFDFSSGFRAGVSLACDCRSSLVLAYSRFENSTSDTMDVVIDPMAETIQPLVLHPGTLDTNSHYLSAWAAQSIDYDLVDLDYRATLLVRECSMINWFVGARYAQLGQDFDAHFTLQGDQDNVITSVDFDGAGIRLGLDGERHHGCGLMLYGKSALSVVAGEFRASYFQNSNFDPVTVQTSWKAGRIVPILDLELGLGWQSPCGRVRCTAGYQVSDWFNTLTTDQWIDQIAQNNFAGQPDGMSYDTLTLDGLTARVEWRF
jgi:hypothetical protein